MSGFMINGKIALEPYVSSGGIKSTGESAGFARVKQKSSLVGLKALSHAKVRDRNGNEETVIHPGDLVYFKEEDLHSSPWAKNLFDCDIIDSKFIVAELAFAVMVKR